MYVADRSKPVLKFIKVSSLENNVQDIKFSKKGLVFYDQKNVYFVPHKKFLAALAHREAHALKIAK